MKALERVNVLQVDPRPVQLSDFILTMYFDLNIPINAPASLKYINNTSKKKGKQKAGDAATATPGQSVTDLFTTEQIAAIENKMDILTHCEMEFSSFYVS